MSNYAALRAYADANPGKTDAELSAMYGSATVVVRQPIVPISDILQWSGSGPIDSIDAAQSFTHEDATTQRQVRAAAKAAIRMFNGGTATFNVDSPENGALLGLFLTLGILSAGEQASLLALGDVTRPLYSQAGEFGSAPSDLDFAAARNLE